MISWLRISGLVKIIFFEAIAAVIFAGDVKNLLVRRGGLFGCPADTSLKLGFGLVVGELIAIAAAGWVLYGIVRAREITQRFQPTVNTGSLVMPNPAVDAADFPFATTSPWYVLADLWIVGWAALFLFPLVDPRRDGCTYVGPFLLGRGMLLVALVFPVARLFCWYVLGIRTSPRAQVGAWKPIALLYAIVAPVAIYGALYWHKLGVAEQRVPVVDARTFAGGLAAHPELSGKVVRIRGVAKTGAARCACDAGDARHCRMTALLVDLDGGGDVVVHGQSYLAADLDRQLKQPLFEEIGRIQPIPDAKTAGRYAYVECGFDQFPPPPPAGRAYLDKDAR